MLTSWRWLVVGFALGIVASCGAPEKPVPCNATTCLGCCDSGGHCRAGTDDAICGTAGGVCAACGSSQLCAAGACSEFDGGSECRVGNDCADQLCTCGDGTRLTAAACQNGYCLAMEPLCTLQCRARGLLGPGEDAGVDAGTCTDGNADQCSDAGLTWNGNQCCTGPEFSLCVDGTDAGCVGPDVAWTGARCCVRAAAARQCVTGSDFFCAQSGFTYTGALCCEPPNVGLCVAGTSTACSGNGLAWTGDWCCARSDFTVCVDGRQADCSGSSMRWTGARCCVKGVTSCTGGLSMTCTGQWTGTRCCR